MKMFTGWVVALAMIAGVIAAVAVFAVVWQ